MKIKNKKTPGVSKRNFRRLKEAPTADPGIARRLEELERKADLHEAKLEFLLAYLRILKTKDSDVIAKPSPKRGGWGRGNLSQGVDGSTARLN
jgi:hypothetical protein